MDLKKHRTGLRHIIWDLVFLLGAASLVYGLTLAWRPLGFIVGGILVSAIAFFIGYRRN